MNGPLAGIKVIDLCQFQNGPSATYRLVENGAECIKVEPLAGDGYRHLVPPGYCKLMCSPHNTYIYIYIYIRTLLSNIAHKSIIYITQGMVVLKDLTVVKDH